MFEAKCCHLVSPMSGCPILRKRTDDGLASDKYTNSFGDRVQLYIEGRGHFLETQHAIDLLQPGEIEHLLQIEMILISLYLKYSTKN